MGTGLQAAVVVTLVQLCTAMPMTPEPLPKEFESEIDEIGEVTHSPTIAKSKHHILTLVSQSRSCVRRSRCSPRVR